MLAEAMLLAGLWVGPSIGLTPLPKDTSEYLPNRFSQLMQDVGMSQQEMKIWIQEVRINELEARVEELEDAYTKGANGSNVGPGLFRQDGQSDSQPLEYGIILIQPHKEQPEGDK